MVLAALVLAKGGANEHSRMDSAGTLHTLRSADGLVARLGLSSYRELVDRALGGPPDPTAISTAAATPTPVPVADPAAPPAPLVEGGDCWITWYSYESCNDAECYMANGERAHPGAAACGYAWPLGTVLRLSTGEVVTCADRGGGPYRWVDVWQGSYTGRGTCEVMG